VLCRLLNHARDYARDDGDGKQPAVDGACNRSAVGYAPGVLGSFRNTRLALGFGLCAFWIAADPVLDFWLAPLHELSRVSGMEIEFYYAPGVRWITFQLVALSAALLALPVLQTEVWLLVCQRWRVPHRPWVAAPLALVTSAVVLWGGWAVRYVAAPYSVTRYWY
jgi:hypothetical protein